MCAQSNCGIQVLDQTFKSFQTYWPGIILKWVVFTNTTIGLLKLQPVNHWNLWPENALKVWLYHGKELTLTSARTSQSEFWDPNCQLCECEVWKFEAPFPPITFEWIVKDKHQLEQIVSPWCTEAASCAIVQLLEVESPPESGNGWMLLTALNLLSLGGSTLIDCMTAASLPSTLVKCLYLFFDLPPVVDGDKLKEGCEFTPTEKRILLQKVFVQVRVFWL